MAATLDDVTNCVLGDVLRSTTLEDALYPNRTMGLPDDVGGDEFPNLTQNGIRPVPYTEEQDAAILALQRKFMRESWGLTDAQIDALDNGRYAEPVNLLDEMKTRGLR